MKKLFSLLMTVVFTATMAFAQSRTVTGTVVSAADDEPLSGATVQPVGGGTGVAADIDGNFSISVPQNVQKLTVSYVGMASKTVDITSGKMVVKLDPAANVLSDVIVTAYGQSTRQAFTGTAAVVSAEQIEKSTVTNVLSSLNGKAPGLQMFNASGQPGSGPSAIRIRGISSVNSNVNNAPLYVLDGIPFTGDISAINPSDIESLTVSTDAASNALYGARGANGVIFITTKRGKAGQSATVTLDAKWGANTRGQQYYNTINDPALYYETYYSALNNYYRSLGLSAEAACRRTNAELIYGNGTGLGYQVYNVPEGELFIGQNGRLNPNATLGRMANYNGEDFYLYPDNWLDNVYSSGLRQEYNVSASNAGDKGDFFASFGYLKNEGIIKNTSYERFTGRLAANSQIKSWLKVGGDLSYAHYDNKSMSGDGKENISSNPLAQAISMAPIYPMYLRYANGKQMLNTAGMLLYDYGNGENAGSKRPAGASAGSNGMSGTLYNTNLTTGNTFRATGTVEIRFLKDFRFTSKNNVYVDEYRGQFLGNPYLPTYASQGGTVSVSHGRHTIATYQQLLNWSHKFGDHNVAALAGHENTYERSASLDADRTQLFLPYIAELDNAVVDGTMSSYSNAYNNEGWLFQAQYDYASKYFANASYRRDASSKFHPDHRWGNFWSVGAAWIISKESFFNADWVNELKYKISYGEQGNDGIPSYLYTNRYSVVNVGDKPGLSPSTVKGNPEITWEKNSNFNTGVEFSLFNYRLTGEVDYFYRKTHGMLYQKPLAASTGYSNIWQNFGDMSNSGIELQLNGTVISTNDWTWTLNFNLTYLRNRIVKLPETNRNMTVEGHEGSASGGYFQGEGLPMYTWYCYDWAGVDPETGEGMYWKDIKDADGNITGREKVTYKEDPTQYLNGTALNDVYGGFGTTLTFRDFDFSMDFAYGLGGKVMDSGYRSYMMTPNANNLGSAFHADVLKAWTPENPNSDIPRWRFGDNDISTSNRFLTSASYLSLQNINFGYTLPVKLTQKFFVQKLRVYFAAENVWLWSKRQGLDPRQSITGDTSNAYYSPIRTFTGGLTLTF